jgi:hypothetical protein
MKTISFTVIIFMITMFIGCGEDPASPEPEILIRVADDDGVNSGINPSSDGFLVLSKNENEFESLSRDEILAYNKYTAEWYIDYKFKSERVVIFNDSKCRVTEYKAFDKPSGEYFYLLRHENPYRLYIRPEYFIGGPFDVKKGKNTIYSGRWEWMGAVSYYIVIGQP